MDYDLRGWLVFWCVLALIAFGGIIGIIRANNEADYRSYQAVQSMINTGADPITARCAVVGWGTVGTASYNICSNVTGKGAK